jgi:uncharacterized protein
MATMEMLARNALLEIIDLHREELKRFGVRRMMLFGSFARGDDNSRSDVNLLVELEPGRTLFDFVRLRNYLHDALGRPVDLTTLEALDARTRERVLAEAVHAA